MRVHITSPRPSTLCCMLYLGRHCLWHREPEVELKISSSFYSSIVAGCDCLPPKGSSPTGQSIPFQFCVTHSCNCGFRWGGSNSRRRKGSASCTRKGRIKKSSFVTDCAGTSRGLSSSSSSRWTQYGWGSTCCMVGTGVYGRNWRNFVVSSGTTSCFTGIMNRHKTRQIREIVSNGPRERTGWEVEGGGNDRFPNDNTKDYIQQREMGKGWMRDLCTTVKQ